MAACSGITPSNEKKLRIADCGLRTGGIRLPSRGHAIQLLHFPEEMADVEIARKRLALDEFIEMQRAMRLRRKKLEERARPIPCAGENNRLIKPFLAGLGFELTDQCGGCSKAMSGPAKPWWRRARF
jgi:RecG-like helicase